MGLVRTLVGFVPLRRNDGIPWSEVDVEQGLTPRDGPWVTIDTQALSPLDADPWEPAARTVTTTEATGDDGPWFRLRFRDADDNVDITESVALTGEGVLLPPSAEDVRSRSKLLQERYPADPFDADVEAQLREVVADATALVEQLTCRTMDDTVPDNLQRVALRAIVLKSEQIGEISYSAATVRASANRGRLRSISAGSWSESYFGPTDAQAAKMLDPNPYLHEALWALATPECRESWLALWTGVFAPASAVQSPDWFPESQSGHGGYGGEFGTSWTPWWH